ncbi:ankyrin repeat domain-containing protein 50 [Microdochium nivale]|nr:ankyrin repeat domain-containing protein 50 [Microdochium nivale]
MAPPTKRARYKETDKSDEGTPRPTSSDHNSLVIRSPPRFPQAPLALPCAVASPRKRARHEDTDDSEEEILQAIDPDQITVAIFCALVLEYTAVRYTLDKNFECEVTGKQSYVYKFGSIGGHNVVIAKPVDMGPVNAAHCAAHVSHQFPNVRLALMVGIGAGIPSRDRDIRLGDVAIGMPHENHTGVVQYDLGKYEDGNFKLKGILNKPPPILMSAIDSLESDELMGKFPHRKILRSIINQNDKFGLPETEDILFDDTFPHVQKGSDCTACRLSADKKVVPRQPRQSTTHRGLILSGGGVVKNPIDRKQLQRGCEGAICFEMEAAGIADELPCLVIRGICDYADTHKHDAWHFHAAAAAAAYSRAVLLRVPADEVKEAMRMREMMSKISEIDQTVKSTHVTTQALHASDQLDKIRRWLTPPDPSTNFNKARQQHHDGTGQWLLQSDTYIKWKKERNSFLWLIGIPGCGKTVLSSSVVNELRHSTTSLSLVYFYFSFNDIAKQSAKQAVQSLITQLYNSRTDLQKDVDTLFSSYNNGGRQLDTASLFKLLHSMIEQAGEIWIVLDALDECGERNDESAYGLFPWIKSLGNINSNVHLLVTSRPEQDIQAAFETWDRASEVIPLKSDLVSDDISAYIKEQTAAITRWRNRPDIREKIETTLVAKAGGMFRWVACQLDVLKECLDPLSVKRELDNLPRTLSATYARILQSIPPQHINHAKRLLQFITYSERPLSIEEAVDVVAVDLARKPRFDPSYRMPEPKEVARYCSSLVVIVERQDSRTKKKIIEIQLAHFSVQEYLTSNELETSMAVDLDNIPARAAIVKVCLSYLIDLSCSEKKASYPFAEFSALCWSDHAVLVEASYKAVIPEVEEYFSSRVAFEFGNELYQPDLPWIDGDRDQGPALALHCASFLGLFYSTQALLKNGADVNAVGGHHRSALQAAIWRGHEKIVQLLLENDTDIQTTTRHLSDPLQTAAHLLNEEMVQLLINHGADVHAQDEDGDALTSAIRGSTLDEEESAISIQQKRIKVIHLLLDHGADVNAQCGYYGNALQTAIGGDVKIVQLLLECGADVNAQGGYYGTVLQAASYKGDEKRVQLLFKHGADVNMQGGYYGNALQAASLGKFEWVTKPILRNGIKVGGYNEIVRTGFDGENKKFVQLLLDEGANVNAQGGYFGNALQAASSTGNQTVVQLLLDKGADVHAQGGFHNSALQAASSGGHEEVVDLLRDHIAELASRGNLSWLQIVTIQGKQGIA